MKTVDHVWQRRWYRPGAPAPYDREPVCLDEARRTPDDTRQWQSHLGELDAAGDEPYGLVVYALRRAAGLSQLELAAAARLCPNTILNLERGRVCRPWKSTHDQIVEALCAVAAVRNGVAHLERAYSAARRRRYAGR